MAVATAVDFKAEVKKLLERFDRQEFAELKDMFADDAQGVDEISRGWIRGKASIDGYFKKLKEMGVSEIRTKARDFDTKQWDDVSLVTCSLDQTYVMGGDRVSITAPMSVLFRRHRGAWKIELIHAVPLPDMD